MTGTLKNVAKSSKRKKKSMKWNMNGYLVRKGAQICETDNVFKHPQTNTNLMPSFPEQIFRHKTERDGDKQEAEEQETINQTNQANRKKIGSWDDEKVMNDGFGKMKIF